MFFTIFSCGVLLRLLLHRMFYCLHCHDAQKYPASHCGLWYSAWRHERHVFAFRTDRLKINIWELCQPHQAGNLPGSVRFQCKGEKPLSPLHPGWCLLDSWSPLAKEKARLNYNCALFWFLRCFLRTWGDGKRTTDFSSFYLLRCSQATFQ